MTRRPGNQATADDAYQAWKAILRVHARMVAELDQRTAEAGVLPPTWLDLLLKLSQAPQQRLRLSDLAETAFLSRDGVTRLVARIEADGLLRREPCPDDGRGAFAVLTQAGSDALRQAGPVYRQTLIDKFATHLTAAGAATVADALEAVLAGNDWTTPSPSVATWHATG